MHVELEGLEVQDRVLDETRVPCVDVANFSAEKAFVELQRHIHVGCDEDHVVDADPWSAHDSMVPVVPRGPGAFRR